MGSLCSGTDIELTPIPWLRRGRRGSWSRAAPARGFARRDRCWLNHGGTHQCRGVGAFLLFISQRPSVHLAAPGAGVDRPTNVQAGRLRSFKVSFNFVRGMLTEFMRCATDHNVIRRRRRCSTENRGNAASSTRCQQGQCRQGPEKCMQCKHIGGFDARPNECLGAMNSNRSLNHSSLYSSFCPV